MNTALFDAAGSEALILLLIVLYLLLAGLFVVSKQRESIAATKTRSPRIRVTRCYSHDISDPEVTEGEPLIFGVSRDGAGWVTIKKDDGRVVCVQHSMPPEQNQYGLVVLEARFI